MSRTWFARCSAICALAVLSPLAVASLASGEMISLSGYVYCDINNDGSFDSFERGIGGVEIWLERIEIPEEIEILEETAPPPLRLSTFTDWHGGYSFDSSDGLIPGEYAITEIQPEKYVQGRPQEICGKVDGTTSGTPVGSDAYEGVFLGDYSQGVGYNFGEWGLKAKYISKRQLLVPEPATLSLFVAGLLVLAGCRRWRLR